MKKLFSLCLALCVVLSSFVVVHADGLQGSGTAHLQAEFDITSYVKKGENV